MNALDIFSGITATYLPKLAEDIALSLNDQGFNSAVEIPADDVSLFRLNVFNILRQKNGFFGSTPIVVVGTYDIDDEVLEVLFIVNGIVTCRERLSSPEEAVAFFQRNAISDCIDNSISAAHCGLGFSILNTSEEEIDEEYED